MVSFNVSSIPEWLPLRWRVRLSHQSTSNAVPILASFSYVAVSRLCAKLTRKPHSIPRSSPKKMPYAAVAQGSFINTLMLTQLVTFVPGSRSENPLTATIYRGYLGTICCSLRASVAISPGMEICLKFRTEGVALNTQPRSEVDHGGSQSQIGVHQIADQSHYRRSVPLRIVASEQYSVC
jgi:hypothetical protein